jgi:hypothetical protein
MMLIKVFKNVLNSILTSQCSEKPKEKSSIYKEFTMYKAL